MPSPYIKATTLDYLEHVAVRADMARLLQTDLGMKSLKSEIDDAGFKPVAGSKGAWGTKGSWTRNDDQTVKFEISLQGFAKPGSKDSMALLIMTMTGPKGETDTYRCSLRAPAGKLANVVERYVDKNNKVLLANSYWTRAWNCIRSTCGGPCVRSLTGCTAGIVPCIVSVLTVCGGCAVKCLACAGCNCRWWCKWAVGCCRD